MVAAKPTRDFSIGGSLTYTDATSTDYVAGPTPNYTGTRLNAPRWSPTINAD